MLIGANFYLDIVENEIIRGNGLTAVKSKHGYLLSGPIFNSNVSTVTTTMMNVLIQHKQKEVDLEKFWNLESLGVTKKETQSTNEQSFYDTYESSIEFQNGKYIAKLPWKDDFDELSSNYQITKIRTERMIRLRKDPDILRVYGDIMADQQKRVFIEKIDSDQSTKNKVHYIPTTV